MTSAQIGKTEMLLCAIGFYIEHDPAPILAVQPTIEMGEAFSKDRLAPLLRDCPSLRGKVKDPRARDSGNTLLHKQFPGGHITIAGANSPASLASRPVRMLVADEIDRWPDSAGTEGDPLDLAKKRTTTFWNRKKVQTSTPTVTGSSRIADAYSEGDQRQYWVPCPDCGEHQVLRWANVSWVDGDPDTAGYACSLCGVLIDLDANKMQMLQRGEWRAQKPTTSHASFHLNELYSPWKKLRDIVDDFLKAKDDRERLKVWTNTSLGETFDEHEEKTDHAPLHARREPYTLAPDGVLAVTLGIDVQADRFELEFVGWGVGEETWSLSYQRLYADTSKAEAWSMLEKVVKPQFRAQSGRVHDVLICCIDSGYLADDVYRWCKRMGTRWAIPVKGSSQRGKPVHAFPRRPKTKQRVYLTEVGTDTAKDILFGRLEATTPGPGYCHWPATDAYDEEYFLQLTGEHRKKFVHKGRVHFEWVPHHRAVEALDVRVYNLAAVRIAVDHMGLDLVAPLPPPPSAPRPTSQTQPAPRPSGSWMQPRRGGWIKR